MLYTLGVGDLSLEHLARRLEYRGIEVVCDLRSPPFAVHRMGTMPSALATRLAAVGIRHEDASAYLGDRPADLSVFVHDGRVDYSRLLKRDPTKQALSHLMTLLQGGAKICLLGRSAEPAMCPRGRFVGHVFAQRGVEVKHINAFDSTVTQEAVEHTVQFMGELLHLGPAAARDARG